MGRKFNWMFANVMLVCMIVCGTDRDVIAQGTGTTPDYAALAGSQPVIKQLRIGDKVPDIVYDKLLNYPGSSLKLSDFKGKLIILDFWGSWCTACVNGFPKMDSLQQVFGDKIKVLLVNPEATGDDLKKAKLTYDRFSARYGRKLRLPAVLFDSVAFASFPFKSFPHYVWIDKDGSFISQTGAHEVNAENIGSILEGKKLKMRQKNEILDYDSNKPLFIDANGGTGSDLKYHSLITGYVEGLSSKSSIKTTPDYKPVGISYINQPLLNIYKTAYSFKGQRNRIFITASGFPHMKMGSEHWDTAKYTLSYSYDLLLPVSKGDKIFTYMQEDLQRFFGYRSEVKLSEVPCLVISSDKDSAKIISKGEAADYNLYYDYKKKYLHNGQLSLLVSALNDKLDLPLINETNITENITIDLPDDLSDVAALKSCFEKYGIRLQQAKRVIEIMTITD